MYFYKQEARRMNPDRNRGGMTVNALMQIGLFLSAAIPVVIIAFLGVFASQRIQSSGNSSDSTTFVLVVVACAIVSLIGILTANYFVQREVKSRLLGLVDVCRDYVSGDRTVRAVVNGDDEFAMLSRNLNALLDSQGNSQGGVAFNSSNGNDAAALQAQIEKLLQEVSAVGDGDLRVQAEVTPDTLGVLADSFNYMIEELAKVVGRVQSTAVQVTNATRRIIDRVDPGFRNSGGTNFSNHRGRRSPGYLHSKCSAQCATERRGCAGSVAQCQ